MQSEERPITLILDCPVTGKTVVTHMREDQLDMFIESCGKEHYSDLDELIREQINSSPEEEEDYFYD